FWKIPEGGRFFVTNFAMGALGYGLPAAIGASYALPEGSTVINFTGDGSLGFVTGEMETLARLGKNIKVVLFNNGNFGWIRGTNHFSFGGPDFSPSFSKTNYVSLANSFGISGFRASTLAELNSALEGLFKTSGPALLELMVPSPEQWVPPVPDWAQKAKGSGRDCDYWG
ncbi:MAG TPA: thiamine pyrophosphate-binding protein, partial [Synergistetes bacterium]|nr:thiamine pyrophosphate-binding protein [Synergistota bacterium]